MIRKLMVLALLLGLFPLVVGCDETVKGSEATKADEKTATDKPTEKSAPVEAKKAKKPDFADFSTADPLIGSAMQSRQQLADQEDALFERLDEVRTLLASAKADPARMRRTIEEFLGIVKEIRRIVIKAGASLTALDESTRDLARSMKHLGSSYKAAAGLFRQKARDYSEKRLQDILNGFAEEYESIGKTIPERTKSLQEFQKTLPKLKGKVREANAFLEDVVLYLTSHPGIGTDPREEYASQVELFVNTFSELLRTLDDFRSTFREQAVSKAIQVGIKSEALAKAKLEDAERDALTKREQAKQVEAERLAQAQRQKEIKEQEQARRAEAERQRLEQLDDAKQQELARRMEENRQKVIVVFPKDRPSGSASATPIQPIGSLGSANRTVIVYSNQSQGPIKHTPPPSDHR